MLRDYRNWICKGSDTACDLVDAFLRASDNGTPPRRKDNWADAETWAEMDKRVTDSAPESRILTVDDEGKLRVYSERKSDD
jgi:hypothetical protein